MAERIARITVVGGGTAGWLAACRIAAAGPALSVTLVESPDVATIGVGEGTWPTMRGTLAAIGIDEADFLTACDASFKQGSRFDGWATGAADDRYYHPFTAPADVAAHDLIAAWDPAAGDFASFACAQPDICRDDLAPRQAAMPPYAGALNYGYHLDAAKLAALLRSHATGRLGVRHIRDHVTGVQAAANGDVAAVVTRDHGAVPGDLFLDCTGFRALLIEGALHAGFDDWTHWLPCDAAIALQTESVGPPVPYTRAMAHDAGWQWRIPLQHRVGNGIVYCSRYLSRDAALHRLLGNVEGKVLTDPNFLRFTTGARRRQWHRNCVAIGLSGGFMEPLESTSIHLIQRAVLRLIRLFPQGGISAADVAEFNDQQMQDMEQIRDFLILHYKITDRRDSPFWRQCAGMDVPPMLARKIALFRETARVFRRNEELFGENSWVQVMLGQGMRPEGYHPIAAKLSDDELDRLLGMVRRGVADAVATMPPHADYVARYCGVADPR